MKPLMLTREQIEKYYKLSAEESIELCEKLDSVGFYERTDNPLFSRKDVEKEIKNG